MLEVSNHFDYKSRRTLKFILHKIIFRSMFKIFALDLAFLTCYPILFFMFFNTKGVDISKKYDATDFIKAESGHFVDSLTLSEILTLLFGEDAKILVIRDHIRVIENYSFGFQSPTTIIYVGNNNIDYKLFEFITVQNMKKLNYIFKFLSFYSQQYGVTFKISESFLLDGEESQRPNNSELPAQSNASQENSAAAGGASGGDNNNPRRRPKKKKKFGVRELKNLVSKVVARE